MPAFKQDDWTIAFCIKYKELRKARLIPTNKVFAEVIGIDNSGLSHVLSGRRNLPQDYRIHAETALTKYESVRHLQQGNFQTSIATIPNAELQQKYRSLCERITVLEKERMKLLQEISSLQDKVIKCQAILIGRLECTFQPPAGTIY